MSGGYFEYKITAHQIEALADAIFDYVKCSDVIEEITDSEETQYERYDEVMKEFHNGIECLRKAAVYARRIDYLLSGDDGEETFFERLREDLKNNNL